MEEKKAERRQEADGAAFLDELRSAPGGVGDRMRMVFTRWEAEGLDPAGMFQRVSELFDLDPRKAEEAFGGDYLDIVDYFTHYWN